MAECQDSSQLRVTYITNDCGPGSGVTAARRTDGEREREKGDAVARTDPLVVRCFGRRIVCQVVDTPIPRLDYHILTPPLLARHRLLES